MTTRQSSGALLCATAVLALFPAIAVGADQDQAAASDTDSAVSQSVEDEAAARIDEKRSKLIGDATLALQKTQEALQALGKGDADAALEALAIATGKLELVVARDPELALAPVDMQIIRRDILGDLASIRAQREEIEELVDDGNIQEARALMRDFGSEIVIQTSSLPLSSYPAAIKRATAQIDAGDMEAATQTLATALSTVVVSEEAIALPVLRAEVLTEAAEAAIGKLAASTDDQATAARIAPAEYVEAAQTQLELAEALGYGDRNDFEDLKDDLEELEDKIEDEQDTVGIFDSIARNFENLKERLVDKRS